MARKDTTLEYLQDRLDPQAQLAARRPLESSWFASLSYYNGQQALAIDELGEIYPIDGENYRANILKQLVDRAVFKVLNTKMELRVMPNSAERRDRHGAMVAQELYNHAVQETRWQAKSKECLKWAAICGTGVYKTVWDPDAGPPERLFFDRDGVPLLNPRGPAVEDMEYTEYRPGDVCVQVLSPFMFYLDPACRDPHLDGAEWCAHVQYMRPHRIRQMFGRWPRGFREDGGASEVNEAELYMRKLQHMIPDVHYDQLDSQTDTSLKDMVRVVEYWERPNRMNKWLGRYIVAVGSDLMANKPNPYARFEIQLPFVPQHWTVSPGRFWGKGLAEELRPIQRTYNESRMHMLEHQRTHSKPILLTPKGSGLARAELRSLNGLILSYRPAVGKPSPLDIPQLPEHVMRNASVAQQEMLSISGQAPPETSKLPGELRSGQAIALMQRDNNLILAEPTLEFAEATEQVGRNLLRIMANMYEEPRTIRAVGRSMRYSVASFSGSDMHGNYDLRMHGEPTPMDAEDAVKANIMEMAQLGVLNPQDPKEKAAILKAMAFRTVDEIIDDSVRFEALQETQLDEIIRNPAYMPIPQEFEDHAAMGRVLERFMLSPEFDGLDDATKGRIRLLWEGRKQILRQQYEAQIQAMEMTKGTPGEAGAPSQPRRAKQ